MSYVLKQIVDAVTAPLILALLLFTIGIVCRRCSWRRTATATFSGALAIAYLGSASVVGDVLIGQLERQYAPLSEDELPAGISTVVVLGSGYKPRDGYPVTAAFDEEGLARIVEGVRLLRHIPDGRLVASGGAPGGMTPSALGYAKLARELGIADDRITVLDRPLDTEAETRAIANLLDSKPFILVTSASHMPRAMRLMRQVGLAPIAAPTGHRAAAATLRCWRCWLPTAAGLRKSERALHEYVGLVALTLRLD